MDHPVYVYVYIREQVKINHVHNKVVNSVKCLGFQYVFQYSNSENWFEYWVFELSGPALAYTIVR